MKQLAFGDLGLITDDNKESWADLMKVIKEMIEFGDNAKLNQLKEKVRKLEEKLKKHKGGKQP